MSGERIDDDNRNIGPIEAYNIILQRNINGDRLLSERTSIFLAASSILFLAFVMLLNPNLAPAFKCLRIALPILGLFLTLLFYSFSRDSHEMLEFYWQAQERIERETDEFVYMREKRCAPRIQRTELREANRNIWDKICYCLANRASKRWFPIIFGLLWIVSLILACLAFLDCSPCTFYDP
jgi:hypothetical protein